MKKEGGNVHYILCVSCRERAYQVQVENTSFLSSEDLETNQSACKI